MSGKKARALRKAMKATKFATRMRPSRWRANKCEQCIALS
jgi:hypothetical protein